jgi:hypothetical protein
MQRVWLLGSWPTVGGRVGGTRQLRLSLTVEGARASTPIAARVRALRGKLEGHSLEVRMS